MILSTRRLDALHTTAETRVPSHRDRPAPRRGAGQTTIPYLFVGVTCQFLSLGLNSRPATFSTLRRSRAAEPPARSAIAARGADGPDPSGRDRRVWSLVALGDRSRIGQRLV